MSFLVLYHLIFLRQGFSLNLELADWLDRLSNKPLGTSCLLLFALGLWICTVTPDCYVGASDPNSGPHSCAVNTLPPQPSLLPGDRTLDAFLEFDQPLKSIY